MGRHGVLVRGAGTGSQPSDAGQRLQYLGTDLHHSGWAARPVQVARDLSD